MPKPIESYIIHEDHCIRWPNFQRNAFVVIFGLLAIVTAWALY
jgi:hypothetical protein